MQIQNGRMSHKNHRRILHLTVILASIVVFVTTYALMHPALALETEENSVTQEVPAPQETNEAEENADTAEANSAQAEAAPELALSTVGQEPATASQEGESSGEDAAFTEETSGQDQEEHDSTAAADSSDDNSGETASALDSENMDSSAEETSTEKSQEATSAAQESTILDDINAMAPLANLNPDLIPMDVNALGAEMEKAIASFKLINYTDGAGDFDADDARGHDSGNQNYRIRSFDSIAYQTEVHLQGETSSGSDSDYLVYQFTIPNNDELQMEWSNMGWAVADTTPVLSADGQSKTYTIRTKEPVTSSGGTGIGHSFFVSVGNLHEGYSIQPMLTASLDKEGASPVSVENTSFNNNTGNSAVMPTTVVTSVPSYNVGLVQSHTLSGINTYNVGGESVQGMLASYALSVEVRQEAENKGIRGLELPNKNIPIEFDIDLSSTFRKDGSDTAETEKLSDYFKFILSNSFANGAANSDLSLPASGQNEGVLNKAVVYQNGNVIITQTADTKLHVTITGFDTKTNEFPTKVLADNNDINTLLNADGSYKWGTISTWRFEVIQTTERDNNGTMQSLTEFYDSQNGTVQVTATVENLTLTSETGTAFGPDSSTGFYETITKDNTQITERQLYGGKALYDHQIFFSAAGHADQGTDGNASGNKNNGSDTAVMGADIYFSAYINEKGVSQLDNGGMILGYDQLVKFDNAALEPVTISDTKKLVNGGANKDWLELTIQYVGKAGGWDHGGYKPWEDGYDDQMKAAKEESEYLHYYDSIEELENAGMECVGLLLKCRGCEHWSADGWGFQIPLKIKNDPTLIGTDNQDADGNVLSSYMITMSTNIRNVEDILNMNPRAFDGITAWEDYSRFARNPENQDLFDFNQYPSNYNVDRDDNYVKYKYGPDGHVGDCTVGFLHGDTVYIVPYTSTVQKHVAQHNPGTSEEKNIFNLDQQQRYVDFVITGATELSGSVNVNKADDWTTTVTLIDTLPDGLTYVPGSAYAGGTYTEKTPEAGTVTDGTPITPAFSKDSEGHTVITFTLENVKVGANIPEVHYSCMIGNTTDPDTDVKNNDSFTNTVGIHTLEDKRDFVSSNSNIDTASFQVNKGQVFNIQKYGTDSLEVDGTGTFRLMINNETANAKENFYAIDFMPQLTNLRNYYRLTGIKVDLYDTTNDITIYYNDILTSPTNNGSNYPLAKVVPLSDITGQKNGWVQATMSADGTIDMTSWPNWPVAIAYVDRTLPGHAHAQIHLTYEARYGTAGEVIPNVFSTDDLYTVARSYVYSRTLSGIAWEDDNRDGKIDGTETRLANVTVALYKLDEHGDPTGEPVLTTTTNENGFYSFGDLSGLANDEKTGKILKSGDYAIVFSGDPLKPYVGVTQKEAAGVDTSVSSKADGTEEGGSFSGAIIRYVHMDTIDEMRADPVMSTTHTHDVPYQNAGFIPEKKVDLNIQKVDADGMTTPLAKAVFTLNRLDPEGTGTYATGADALTQVSAATDNKGKTKFEQLPDGFYEIRETTMPDGYVLYGDGKFYIRIDYGTVTLLQKDAQKPVKEWGILETAEKLTYEAATSTFTVGNEAGIELPSTGGVGTYGFTITGSLLILGAGLLLLKLRRWNEQ